MCPCPSPCSDPGVHSSQPTAEDSLWHGMKTRPVQSWYPVTWSQSPPANLLASPSFFSFLFSSTVNPFPFSKGFLLLLCSTQSTSSWSTYLASFWKFWIFPLELGLVSQDRKGVRNYWDQVQNLHLSSGLNKHQI